MKIFAICGSALAREISVSQATVWRAEGVCPTAAFARERAPTIRA